ncbi:signal peptidase I [Candidatus Gottesmanbacteria bacterium RIFCSPLOWO2_01_FULL_43_11b]|uniref:Signal peptidase I n=1 Tax=Candidatus Gottesmanbacteria bacterium RIFCSPLOWO2_01_FULL_43_11b TaxID=1798392 RepID=A0A1F6AJH2_9BACT|nr:MAG: signal peptidase I [Candidatus Gottesmanbacteria bacterium RIFCSPLOWO2_01_FULL_43_11b]
MDFIKRAVVAIFDFLQSIVVVMAIMVMIYLFVMSPQEIKGASMEPSFINGEYILTNKILYKIKDPKRGEVVIFKSPGNPEIDYIKRIIGLPGDTVMLRNDTMYVNDSEVEEPYLSPDITIFGGSYLTEDQEIVVPEGEYFVMGDNRPHSADSREFGTVPKEDFIGKAFLRYWPFSKFGVVPQPSYEIP